MISSTENDDAQLKSIVSDVFGFVEEPMKSSAKDEEYETPEALLRALNESKAF